MENNIQVFNSAEFGEVRTVVINNEPWFVGKDVATALGYGVGKSLANAVANHVDEEDKGVTEMMTPGGRQKITIINESGLYSLVLSSKAPKAKEFKRWVTADIIPSMRKTGRNIVQIMQNEPNTSTNVFNNSAFGDLTVITIDRDNWFVLSEICEKLDVGNQTVKDRLRDKDYMLMPYEQASRLRLNRKLNSMGLALITETGLYEAIMSSRKPEAKDFRYWVCDVVLPSIRKNGGYISGQEELTPEQIVAKALIVANKIIEEKDRQLAEAREKTKFLESTIEEQKPKVSYYDIVLQNNSLTPITVIAKDYGMSAVKFNNVLSELKVQYKVNGTWVLYQDYANCGYTGTKTGLTKVGTAYVQTQWTQSGRRFIYDILKGKMNILPLVER